MCVKNDPSNYRTIGHLKLPLLILMFFNINDMNLILAYCIIHFKRLFLLCKAIILDRVKGQMYLQLACPLKSPPGLIARWQFFVALWFCVTRRDLTLIWECYCQTCKLAPLCGGGGKGGISQHNGFSGPPKVARNINVSDAPSCKLCHVVFAW